MLGISDFPESSGTASGGREGEDGGGGAVPTGCEEEERVRGEESDRNFAGNRWPREETLALLKIRSDMDVVFRDSSLKAPLWEEVSRKLGELGYHRNAKKCKEKFENIFKYHKRTKEGRSNRQNGKNYRFFEQLEALDNHPLMPPPSPVKYETSTPMAASMPQTNPIDVTNVSQGINAVPCSIQKPAVDCVAASTSTTSSSGKESEGSRKKKRKWGVFFEKLMKEVIEKQENLQRKFIEAIEKCEQDRIAREEAWKLQELDRIKREHEILVQERSIAAAKDAAVLAFLQKIAEQAGPVQLPENPSSEKVFEKQDNSNGENSIQMSSSRWPKAEVEALIRLRTNFDMQYQESGPKGPLWEEISLAMRKIGYERSAKRCKEKWENINKYFKRVRDSNKRRPEDSKTCPYFHQLDALYKEKTKKVENPDNNSGYNLKPEDILMQMMGQSEQRPQSESVTEEGGSENVNANQEEEEEEEEEEEDGDEEGGDGDEDDEADGYQIVANNTSSMAIMG
ncbi:hypothetical protein VitviT2T_005849 [Vitis vinifera]|uniref:Myb-like domain-containing protein n=2 Tax=Vitis vinifera TaxID=29760 RepID=F6I0I8_VITVI|nr:trihelix transcription factor DF1 [Vitis vinifera]WJZ86390.1 hypothetical protein VitviT2T_005849 [Vitis vinifera]|eukprot:XP_002276933.1 PREDICTED: trihelix transcription factor GT-2 [Vitis vinifera]